MTLWIGKNSVYEKAKSLKDYEAKLKRTSANKSFRVIPALRFGRMFMDLSMNHEGGVKTKTNKNKKKIKNKNKKKKNK